MSVTLFLWQQFGLILCNSIGSPLDCKYISFAPTFLAMSTTHVVAATYTGFYVWHFKNIKQLATLEVGGMRKAGSEKCVIIFVLLISDNALAINTQCDKVMFLATRWSLVTYLCLHRTINYTQHGKITEIHEIMMRPRYLVVTLI